MDKNNDFEYWRCAKIFLDESWIDIEPNKTILILGALICPPGCTIEADLENRRQEIEFIDEIHSENLSGDKALALSKKFIDTFITSKTIFRAIIFPKKDPEFTQYCFGEDWRLVSKSIKILLNNLWICSDKKTRLIKPKIILDFNHAYAMNKETITTEIISSLRRNEEYTGEVFRRFPGARFTLMDSKIFEAIQLTDILVASIKWDIKEPENENKKQFRDYVKVALNQPRLFGVPRWATFNKFDSWLFKEAEGWLISERVTA